MRTFFASPIALLFVFFTVISLSVYLSDVSVGQIVSAVSLAVLLAFTYPDLEVNGSNAGS